MQYSQEIINRLNRIEGQTRGIQKMITEGRECLDIVQQLKALQSAARSVSRELVRQYLGECLVRQPFSGNTDINRLLALIDQLEE
jgi:DNA-binding FrmR family transcriptional regulator